MKMVAYCFDDFPAVFRKCFDSLEPGGWLELNDSTSKLVCNDGSIRGTDLEAWSQRMSQAHAIVGRDPDAPKQYKQWMVDIGFVDVVEQFGLLPGVFNVPILSALLLGCEINVEMVLRHYPFVLTLNLLHVFRQPMARGPKFEGTGQVANDEHIQRNPRLFLQAPAGSWYDAARS